MIRSHREAFRKWFSEQDVTVGGPKRGLRHILPVRSHPALVDPVGRSGELAGERPEDDPIVFPSAVPASLLAEVSRLSGAEIARRSGLPPRTAQRLASGSGEPSPVTVDLAVVAVVCTKPARCAAGAECRHAEGGLGALLDRSHRRWCSEPCRNVEYRRARGVPARRRRADALADHPAPRPSSSKGPGIPVVKRLDVRAFAGEPSCPTCGSIFMGRVPQICPDCGSPLQGRAPR